MASKCFDSTAFGVTELIQRPHEQGEKNPADGEAHLKLQQRSTTPNPRTSELLVVQLRNQPQILFDGSAVWFRRSPPATEEHHCCSPPETDNHEKQKVTPSPL